MVQFEDPATPFTARSQTVGGCHSPHREALGADEPGFISLVVLAEVMWVQVSLYSVGRAGVAEIVSGLVTTGQLRLKSADLVWRAKRRYEASKADFSDAFIAECAVAADCKRSVTFHRAAAATSGFELLT